MTETPNVRLARQISLAVPCLLLAGAYIGEFGFGLYPCEMCWWQRWPHFAAIALGLGASFIGPSRVWTGLAALAILTSGLIGLFHAGVEYGWWEGITGCATTAGPGEDVLDSIMNAPIVRCDQAPWDLLGVSLAGWNFLISAAAAGVILWLIGRKGKHAA